MEYRNQQQKIISDMKKYFTLMVLTIFGGLFMISCDRVVETTPVQDNDTYSKVYDITENFVKSNTSNSLYGINKEFVTPLYNSDVVLVYRQDGTSGGSPIWKLLPKTYFLSQGELDYNFDFSKYDVQIYANANFDMVAQDAAFKNSYLNNQKFRIVIVPASFGARNSSSVNYDDYNAVIKYYKIDDSKVKSL